MNKSKTSSETPRLIVVMTAPSGTGKTTVAERVFAAEPELGFSVSVTTRPPREGEVDGEDYHFVSDEAFDQLVADDAFAEWAHVHKQRYGTTKAEIAKKHDEGFDVLLDVDVQGAHAILDAYPNAVSIFILPPSMAELGRRLRGRGSESIEQLTTRLATARSEIFEAAHFRYLIVNDDLDDAVAAFRAILAAERQRFACQAATWRELVAEVKSEEGAS